MADVAGKFLKPLLALYGDHGTDDMDLVIDLYTKTVAGFADDAVIEINLTPNRPDCTGVHGIARDLAAADLGTFKDASVKPVKGAFPSSVSVTSWPTMRATQ